MSLVRSGEDALRPEDIDQLESLQHSGQISRYTLIAYNNSSLMFRTPGSGEMHFAGIGMGIQPDKYPLAGSLAIGDPADARLPALLQRDGDVIVTRDIAERYHLKVGDSLILSDLHIGSPVKGTLRAIADDTPNHHGEKIYYSVETAQILADGQPVINTAIVNSDQAQTVVAKLQESGWSVDWAVGRAG